ncbi:MAG: septum formation initiator family protein [bacterium]
MAQSNKKTIRKILGSKTFLVLILFALIGIVLSVGRESYNKYQLTKEINKLKGDIEKIEGRNSQLADLMDYFSEDSFLEKEAKVKLNLQKPGEKVVIFSDVYSDDVTDSVNSQEAIDNSDNQDNNDRLANCWKWWEYFFNPPLED